MLRRILLVVAAAMVACTPAMNWRDTAVGRLSVLLPCKPDRAQRTVRLADQDVSLNMAGCEAGGALFAISHVQLAAPQAVMGTQAAWRTASLASMKAGHSTDVAFPAVTGITNMTRIAAQGIRPDGSAVQAQLAWLVAGTDIFQIAVYADRLGPDMLDNLFSGIRLQ